MDLDAYENLIHKRIIGQQNIMNLKKKNIDFENKKINQNVINAELFKLITKSNEKMIDKIEEKNDKITDVINTLPYYQNYQNQEQEQLSLPLDRDEKQIYNFSEPLQPIEEAFLDDLSQKDNNVFLYKKKDGKDVYSDVKIIHINKLNKATDDELKNQYES